MPARASKIFPKQRYHMKRLVSKMTFHELIMILKSLCTVLSMQRRRKIRKIGGCPADRTGSAIEPNILKWVWMNTFMGVPPLEAISFLTKHWLKPCYCGTILQYQCQILGGGAKPGLLSRLYSKLFVFNASNYRGTITYFSQQY